MHTLKIRMNNNKTFEIRSRYSKKLKRYVWKRKVKVFMTTLDNYSIKIFIIIQKCQQNKKKSPACFVVQVPSV